MDVLVNFLLNNYIWLLIVCLIIVFALIGYLVDASDDTKKKTKNKVKPISNIEDNNFKVHPSVQAYTNDNFDEPLIK